MGIEMKQKWERERDDEGKVKVNKKKILCIYAFNTHQYICTSLNTHAQT